MQIKSYGLIKVRNQLEGMEDGSTLQRGRPPPPPPPSHPSLPSAPTHALTWKMIPTPVHAPPPPLYSPLCAGLQTERSLVFYEVVFFHVQIISLKKSLFYN